jgi:NhaP-type Na+/H+ or K+/H+ antiporter
MILGIFHTHLGNVGHTFEYVSQLDGHSLLFIFIPLLIFESSFNADTYTFVKSLGQIVLLAFPAVVMTIFLIALTLMYILGYNSIFNWGMALSLSSILAATDPVAVVAILKSTGAKIKLNMIIEGESLLNDGSAAIFFFVFVELVITPGFSFSNFIVQFLRLTFGGIGLGLLVGIVFAFITTRLHNDKLVVVFTFLAAYLTFFLAEASMVGFKVSGILSVVTLGLYLGAFLRPKLNPHYLHTLHSVWGFAGFMMETLLFLLTGGYIGIFIRTNMLDTDKKFFEGIDVAKLFMFNLLLLLIRFFVLAIWWPLLNCVGYKITWKEYIIMSYSGLRGAIGLALGLFIALNENYPEQFRIMSILYISGVIFFTVFIQGLTLKPIMKAIGYNRFSVTKLKLFKDLHRRLFLNILEKSESLRANKKISYLVSWESIYQIFDFPNFILDLSNIETQGKPLVMDENYHNENHQKRHSNIIKEDLQISDDEDDLDEHQKNDKTEKQKLIFNANTKVKNPFTSNKTNNFNDVDKDKFATQGKL